MKNNIRNVLEKNHISDAIIAMNQEGIEISLRVDEKSLTARVDMPEQGVSFSTYLQKIGVGEIQYQNNIVTLTAEDELTLASILYAARSYFHEKFESNRH
jgi:hypothetical protein